MLLAVASVLGDVDGVGWLRLISTSGLLCFADTVAVAWVTVLFAWSARGGMTDENSVGLKGVCVRV